MNNSHLAIFSPGLDAATFDKDIKVLIISPSIKKLN